jgi:hypothetical protein
LEVQGDKLSILNIIRKLERARDDEDNKNKNMFEVLVGQVPEGSTEDSHYGTDDIENVKDNYFMMGDILVFQFESRWSPPDKFTQLLSGRFNVKTELYYEEMGADFCGKSWYTNGEHIETEDYTYLEGIYVFGESEQFWSEALCRIESYMECEDNITEDGTEYIEDNFDYVDESDKKDLLLMYKNEYGNYYGCEVE